MSNVMQPNQKSQLVRMLGVVAAIVVIAFVSFFAWRYWNQSQKANLEKKKNLVADIAGPTPAGNVVKTRAEVTTRCFSFTVERTISYGPIGDCSVELTYGSDVLNKLAVKPGYPSSLAKTSIPTDPNTSFVDAYKAVLAKSTDVIKAEEVTLDGQKAGLFIAQDRTSKQKTAQLIGFSKSTSTNSAGQQIRNAYTLTTPYYSDEQQQVLKGIIDSWKWK